MKVNRGKIKHIEAPNLSGLLTLLIADEFGQSYMVHADNPSTIRALGASFPGFIVDGVSFDLSIVIDKEVFWWYDDLGLYLGGIVPVNDATEFVLAEMIESGDAS